MSQIGVQLLVMKLGENKEEGDYNNKYQDWQEKRKSVWPKVLGLEQMLYDLDIRREEALSEVSNTTFKNYKGIELEEEDFVDDENQVKDTKKRKEKKVLRLSHISEYEKLPDLMIGEDRNLSSTRNMGDIEVFSDNLSNPDSIYPE
ncbi:hypothetical protein L873DRAFT_1792302 [Choiromyces venosus 120613-1]|uniref:Uncharacterized protein n=1 Tax=Choiromyces venosus 120613-1 TaxID=1336337 RepID=A0A3N4JAW9_9PEZI|nr:hypothetical protein L873DRAFT_1792302 [Choiromyces venosus 120613-1]